MRRRGMIILAAAISVVFFGSSSGYADPQKGMRAYKKFMKELTGINGGRFAARHTQEEWKELFENHAEAFKNETLKEFQQTKKFLKDEKFIKFQEHLRDFLIKYGSDSGNIPNC